MLGQRQYTVSHPSCSCFSAAFEMSSCSLFSALFLTRTTWIWPKLVRYGVDGLWTKGEHYIGNRVQFQTYSSLDVPETLPVFLFHKRERRFKYNPCYDTCLSFLQTQKTIYIKCGFVVVSCNSVCIVSPSSSTLIKV